MVTLFKEFIEVVPNMSITIPFVIDHLRDVVITFGRFLVEDVEIKIETKDGVSVPFNITRYRKIIFKENQLRIGEYRLIITSGDDAQPSHSKLTIQAESDLQMETIIIPSTANTKKYGSIKTHLFLKDGNVPVENATVSVGDHIFNYAGNGLYISTFPPGFTDESVLINVLARGYHNGVAFQRYHGQVAKAMSGELVFIGPYNWKIYYDKEAPSSVKSIILEVGVEVKKKAKYEVAAWITDVTDKEDAATEQDWSEEANEDSKRKRAGSGNEWHLEIGYHNLEIVFEDSEVLECGQGPYRLYSLIACYENEDNTCDAILDPTGFPLLVLDKIKN